MGVEPTEDTVCPPTGLKPMKPTGTYPLPQQSVYRNDLDKSIRRETETSPPPVVFLTHTFQCVLFIDKFIAEDIPGDDDLHDVGRAFRPGYIRHRPAHRHL